MMFHKDTALKKIQRLPNVLVNFLNQLLVQLLLLYWFYIRLVRLGSLFTALLGIIELLKILVHWSETGL